MRYALIVSCLLGFLLVATSLSAGETRTWTRKNGKEFQAEFVKRDGEDITLRRPNGNVMTIPMQNLSDKDQKYVEQVAKETKKDSNSNKEQNDQDKQKKNKGDRRRGDQGTLKESRGGEKQETKNEQPLTGQVSREQFRQAVIGKTPEEVIGAVGKPDSTMDVGDNSWFYRGRTVDPVTGKADFTTIINFKNGKADSVAFL